MLPFSATSFKALHDIFQRGTSDNKPCNSILIISLVKLQIIAEISSQN